MTWRSGIIRRGTDLNSKQLTASFLDFWHPDTCRLTLRAKKIDCGAEALCCKVLCIMKYRSLRVKLVLPALTEATSPLFRPIKYSLFPPLGLATLAAYLPPDDEAESADEHVSAPRIDDAPDLVVIQVYITSARRAYEIADSYRARGIFVALGGLHVTSLP